MRLLIVTQVVDRKDPILGFFHHWIEKLAEHTESVHVVCLKKGEHGFSKNVVVHSLGKEEGEVSRTRYTLRFWKFICGLRREYDLVLVHMNQEYVLIGSWLWLLLGKPVYMWRNHYSGSVLTDIAAFFCTKVFCTSKFSYTAKYKNTVLMPAGVDTEIFKLLPEAPRKIRSILFFGRMSRSKRPKKRIKRIFRTASGKS